MPEESYYVSFQKVKFLVGFFSLVLPGVGQAILCHPWKGLTINLTWKLFLLAILFPVVALKYYLLGAVLLLGGIAFHSVVLSRKVPSPRPVRIWIFLLFFLMLEFGEISLIRSQVMKYYRIHDISMQPTLLDGDLVLLDRISSLFDPYQHDDVVIFYHPHVKRKLVKRIAGLKEKKGLFVLGDNRNHSLDSRVLGTIPTKNIFGKVSRIVWSFDSQNKRIRWERIGMPILPFPFEKKENKT